MRGLGRKLILGWEGRKGPVEKGVDLSTTDGNRKRNATGGIIVYFGVNLICGCA